MSIFTGLVQVWGASFKKLPERFPRIPTPLVGLLTQNRQTRALCPCYNCHGITEKPSGAARREGWRIRDAAASRDAESGEGTVAFMTWEIAVGLFTIVSAFIAVMNVVVKVNRTLTSLESAVNRLNQCIERQTVENENIFTQLGNHELRITLLEDIKKDRNDR